MFIITSEEFKQPMLEQMAFAREQVTKYNKKAKVAVLPVSYKGHIVQVVWAKTNFYNEKLAIENAHMYIDGWMKGKRK